MCDWNDVLTALNQDSAIQSWTPLPRAHRAVQAAIHTANHGEITIVIDNDSHERWLQLLISVSDTCDAKIWETTGWCLRDMPTIGLAQLGAGIAIRHGILMPTSINAITNGITLAVTAATTLYDATSEPAHGQPRTNRPGPTPADK
ncbi:hypothetical protein [Arthrobacter sp. Z4-13]